MVAAFKGLKDNRCTLTDRQTDRQYPRGNTEQSWSDG